MMTSDAKNAQLRTVNELIAELLDCKYLFAETRIVKLLKGIATCPDVVSAISEAAQDFNFEYEFVMAKKSVTDENGNSTDIFTLPREDDKIVALVFYMLYKIDAREFDLQAFLTKYFYVDGQHNKTYEKFCEEVILPFADSLAFLVTGFRPERKTQVVKKLDDEIIFDDKEIDSVHVLIRRVVDEVLSSSPTEGQKNEVMIVANGFGDAMLTLSREQILLAWVGFKNTVKEFKNVNKLLVKIESYLTKVELV